MIYAESLIKEKKAVSKEVIMEEVFYKDLREVMILIDERFLIDSFKTLLNEYVSAF